MQNQESWKRRKPKVPGSYWLAAPVGYTPRIVKVWDDGFGELYLDGETKGWKLTSGLWKGCLWSGPLTPPSLPNDKTLATQPAKENSDSK